MAINKVVYKGHTLVDLTQDTVTPESLMEGVTAHAKNGEIIIGVAKIGGEGEKELAAGLYEAGTLNLYNKVLEHNQQSADVFKALLTSSWDDLASSGDVVVNDGVFSLGSSIHVELPAKNEYGFYYGVEYIYKTSYRESRMTFYEDGSVHSFADDTLEIKPAGFATYSNNSIYMSEWDWTLTVTEDGLTLADEYDVYSLKVPFMPEGDFILINDNSITSIGERAFYEMKGLTGIVIPDGVISIGLSAFYNCGQLKHLTIGKDVKIIGNSAFEYCTSLSSIILPDGVEKIEGNAFHNCYGLQSIEIPASLTTIEQWAFASAALKSITFKGTKEQWNAINKGQDWDQYIGDYTIYCTDGTIEPVENLPS